LLFYFSEKFPKATSLPFGVFMTPEFEFVHGFTGSRSVEQFQADLDLVEQHPLFPATEKDALRLVKLGEKAAKAAAAEKWAKVLKTGREGAAIRGACAERDALDEAVAAARAYAESRFMWIEEQVKTTDDLPSLTKELLALRKLFQGGPESETAKLGMRAVKTALFIRTTLAIDEARAKMIRAQSALKYEGTRWEWLFRERPPRKLSDDEIDWENISDDDLLDDPTEKPADDK